MSPPARRRVYGRIGAAVLALAAAGCSLSYIDAAGDRHVVGLVDITVHPSAAPQTFAGDVADITAIGLSVGQTAAGGYITAGYSREVTAALRNNALVVGNPLILLTRPKTEPDRSEP